MGMFARPDVHVMRFMTEWLDSNKTVVKRFCRVGGKRITIRLVLHLLMPDESSIKFDRDHSTFHVPFSALVLKV